MVTNQPPNPLRIIFMGTAEIACPVLKELAAHHDFQIAAVVSQPDRPKGRKLTVQPSPVKTTALDLDLPILQPNRCREESFLAELKNLKPDLIAVMAYGQILPSAILELPPLGCMNVHTSLLPKYRGAAPIQWAIWNGDSETGVTITRMDAGLDTGDILSAEKIPITATDTAQTIHDRLGMIGADLLVKTIHGFANGEIIPTPQTSEGVTLARKITREDGRLDWSKTAHHLGCQVRALTPWPGTFSEWVCGDTTTHIKIWTAEPTEAPDVEPGQVMKADREGIVITCGKGALRILELQKQGGRRLVAQDFLSGNVIQPGDRFI